MNWAIVSIVAHVMWIAWLMAVIVAIHVIDGGCIRFTHRPVLIVGLGATVMWFMFLAVSTVAGPITRGDIAILIRVTEATAALLMWTWFALMVKAARRRMVFVVTESRA